MRYNYELKNNHYVVSIDGHKYLIDTGMPYSFWINPPMSVEIDETDYQLAPNQFDRTVIEETNKLVGETLDGFIGYDIIRRNGLTIYKDGTLEFKAINVEGGIRLALQTAPCLLIDVHCGGISGKAFIDTGAMLGYGAQNLFQGLTPYANNVHDYNFVLKHMYSDMYHLPVELNGHAKIVNAGYNQNTVGYPLGHSNIILICNVSTFFDEVCVFDIAHRELILK